MNELALTESVVSEVRDRIASARVRRVCLEVGRLTATSSAALQICFEICARGTSLEGAVLEIVETGARELRIREVELGRDEA